MNVDVLVFDLDGTLANTLPAIARAFNKTLTYYNYEVFEEERYKDFIGNSFTGVYERIKDILNIKEDEETFLEKVRSEYSKNLLDGVYLYDGICELLDYATKKGKILAISTNKDYDFAIRHIEKLLNNWEFKYVFGNTVKYPRKPDPYSINYIKEDIKTNSIVLIGDMLVDFNTAKNANIEHIHCEYGYENRPIDCKYKVKNAKDIIGLIK